MPKRTSLSNPLLHFLLDFHPLTQTRGKLTTQIAGLTLPALAPSPTAVAPSTATSTPCPTPMVTVAHNASQATPSTTMTAPCTPYHQPTRSRSHRRITKDKHSLIVPLAATALVVSVGLHQDQAEVPVRRLERILGYILRAVIQLGQSQDLSVRRAQRRPPAVGSQGRAHLLEAIRLRLRRLLPLRQYRSRLVQMSKAMLWVAWLLLVVQ